MILFFSGWPFRLTERGYVVQVLDKLECVAGLKVRDVVIEPFFTQNATQLVGKLRQ